MSYKSKSQEDNRPKDAWEWKALLEQFLKRMETVKNNKNQSLMRL